MEHTEKALYEGFKKVKPGNQIDDISHEVEVEIYAYKHNLGVMWTWNRNWNAWSPEVRNYGKEGTGSILKEGMVIVLNKC